jgi:hypothetical protein
MLYYLFVFLLRPHFSPLNVFRYITVRTAMARRRITKKPERRRWEAS